MNAEWNVKVIDGNVTGTGTIPVNGLPHGEFVALMLAVDHVLSCNPEPAAEATPLIPPSQKPANLSTIVTDILNNSTLTAAESTDIEGGKFVCMLDGAYRGKYGIVYGNRPDNRVAVHVIPKNNTTYVIREFVKVIRIDTATDVERKILETFMEKPPLSCWLWAELKVISECSTKEEASMKYREMFPSSNRTYQSIQSKWQRLDTPPTPQPVSSQETTKSERKWVAFPGTDVGGDGSPWLEDTVEIIGGSEDGKTGKILQFVDDNPDVVQVLFDDGVKTVDYDSLSFVSRPPDEEESNDEKPLEVPEQVTYEVPSELALTRPKGDLQIPLSGDPRIGDTVRLLFRPNSGKNGRIKNIIDGKTCIEIGKGEQVIWLPRSDYEIISRETGTPREIPAEPYPEPEWIDAEDEILKRIPDNRVAITEYRREFPGSKKSHQKLGARWRFLHKDDKKPDTPPVTDAPTPVITEQKPPIQPQKNDVVEIIKGFHSGKKGVVKRIVGGSILIEAEGGLTTWCLIKDEIKILAHSPPETPIPADDFKVGSKVRKKKNYQLGVGKVVEVRKDAVRVSFGENSIFWFEKKNLEIVKVGDGE